MVHCLETFILRILSQKGASFPPHPPNPTISSSPPPLPPPKKIQNHRSLSRKLKATESSPSNFSSRLSCCAIFAASRRFAAGSALGAERCHSSTVKDDSVWRPLASFGICFSMFFWFSSGRWAFLMLLEGFGPSW